MVSKSTPFGSLALPLILICLAPSATAQCRLHELAPADGAAGDYFGLRVALHGDRAVVGGPAHDHQGILQGGAWVYDVTTGSEILELFPLGGSTGDTFGLDVSLDGSQVLVAARGAQVAYVFDLATGQQLLELTASDGFPGDSFAETAAIDGSRAIVGAPRDDDRGFHSGSAYIFDTGTGMELFKLSAGKEGDWFGTDVDIDGTRAIVGAPWNGKAGAAYVYDLTTGKKLFRLIPADGKQWDAFGWSVALDGDRAIVGAFEKDAVFEKSGAAYVFDLTTGQQLLRLTPSDAIEHRRFGWRVDLQGSRVIVSNRPGVPQGAAYVFDVDTGEELLKLETLDKPSTDAFGEGVAIHEDRALIGAPGANILGDNSGTAYVFSVLDSVGTNYCGPAISNSTGSAAEISASGCVQVAENFLKLEATKLPADRFGYFLASETQGFQASPPGSQGNLCLAGNIARFREQLGSTGPAGRLTIQVDLTSIPTSPPHSVLAGETWNFQCWFRDANPSPTSNFTDGVSITFL